MGLWRDAGLTTPKLLRGTKNLNFHLENDNCSRIDYRTAEQFKQIKAFYLAKASLA